MNRHEYARVCVCERPTIFTLNKHSVVYSFSKLLHCQQHRCNDNTQHTHYTVVPKTSCDTFEYDDVESITSRLLLLNLQGDVVCWLLLRSHEKSSIIAAEHGDIETFAFFFSLLLFA